MPRRLSILRALNALLSPSPPWWLSSWAYAALALVLHASLPSLIGPWHSPHRQVWFEINAINSPTGVLWVADLPDDSDTLGWIKANYDVTYDEGPGWFRGDIVGILQQPSAMIARPGQANTPIPQAEALALLHDRLDAHLPVRMTPLPGGTWTPPPPPPIERAVLDAVIAGRTAFASAPVTMYCLLALAKVPHALGALAFALLVGRTLHLRRLRASLDAWASNRCPRCHYDRAVTPFDAPCPECGGIPRELLDHLRRTLGRHAPDDAAFWSPPP